VSESELQLAKNYLCGMHRIEMENVSVQAAMISNLDVLGYKPEFFLDREQRIRSVRMETVKELASHWLSEDNQYTHILL
jgi:predicted Zn-dependent peptidase